LSRNRRLEPSPETTAFKAVVVHYTSLRDQRGLAAPTKYRGQLARDLQSALDQLQDWVGSAPAERPR
jgi:hypothetical protein